MKPFVVHVVAIVIFVATDVFIVIAFSFYLTSMSKNTKTETPKQTKPKQSFRKQNINYYLQLYLT